MADEAGELYANAKTPKKRNVTMADDAAEVRAKNAKTPKKRNVIHFSDRLHYSDYFLRVSAVVGVNPICLGELNRTTRSLSPCGHDCATMEPQSSLPFPKIDLQRQVPVIEYDAYQTVNQSACRLLGHCWGD